MIKGILKDRDKNKLKNKIHHDAISDKKLNIKDSFNYNHNKNQKKEENRRYYKKRPKIDIKDYINKYNYNNVKKNKYQKREIFDNEKNNNKSFINGKNPTNNLHPIKDRNDLNNINNIIIKKAKINDLSGLHKNNNDIVSHYNFKKENNEIKKKKSRIYNLESENNSKNQKILTNSINKNNQNELKQKHSLDNINNENEKKDKDINEKKLNNTFISYYQINNSFKLNNKELIKSNGNKKINNIALYKLNSENNKLKNGVKNNNNSNDYNNNVLSYNSNFTLNKLPSNDKNNNISNHLKGKVNLNNINKFNVTLKDTIYQNKEIEYKNGRTDKSENQISQRIIKHKYNNKNDMENLLENNDIKRTKRSYAIFKITKNNKNNPIDFKYKKENLIPNENLKIYETNKKNKTEGKTIQVKSYYNMQKKSSDTINKKEIEKKKNQDKTFLNVGKKLVGANIVEDIQVNGKDSILKVKPKILIDTIQNEDKKGIEENTKNLLKEVDYKKYQINNSNEQEQKNSKKKMFENNNLKENKGIEEMKDLNKQNENESYESNKETIIKKNNKILEKGKKNEEAKNDNKNIINENYKKRKYGFINIRNNCYLNSSLQLLTRIDDLKYNILKVNYICKDTVTKGELINEFKNILNKIENNNTKINPEYLKNIMGKISDIYNDNNQEDANEFISHFINALLGETANKNIKIKKLEIYNEMEDMEQKAYDIFYKKFYIKKGYSFIIDLFYGILKIEKYCKNEKCKKMNSIKFNAYNMLEFSIADLANQKRDTKLNINELIKKYISEYKNDYENCKFCTKKDIYIKRSIYTLPKYLIIFFARTVGDEYFNNKIDYDKYINFRSYCNNTNNNNYSYILDCVIEHSGNAHFGHYTALCPIDNYHKYWYRFSDEDFYEYEGYKSNNAIILLYKYSDI